mmetsp:Transcript_11610/g.28986  ORF Transcript_11610/g.28986 Transcript_11610/m.28986 type:complete len:270 (-) Transcript_11610:231-1040(-)
MTMSYPSRGGCYATNFGPMAKLMVTRSFFWYCFVKAGVRIMSVDADAAFFRNPFKKGHLDTQRFSLELSVAVSTKGKFMHPHGGYLCNVRKGYATALRDEGGKQILCGAVPPPYFAGHSAEWWFERHTRLALLCQYDIQTDTTADLEDFYPNNRRVRGESTMYADVAGTGASGTRQPIVQDGDVEFHGQLNMSRFEPLPRGCNIASGLRFLPMDFIVEKCSHMAPFNQAKDNGVHILFHANCATGRGGSVKHRAAAKTAWLNASGLWYL